MRPWLIINLDGVTLRAVLMLLLTFLGTGNKVAAAQALPAVTPSAHRVKRALLFSLDGLHALDLANYVKARPNSSLAQLSQHGVTYKNAHTSLPSNSWPGWGDWARRGRRCRGHQVDARLQL